MMRKFHADRHSWEGWNTANTDEAKKDNAVAIIDAEVMRLYQPKDGGWENPLAERGVCGGGFLEILHLQECFADLLMIFNLD